jgi:hypothetical protein
LLCWSWRRSSGEKGGSQGGGELAGRRRVGDDEARGGIGEGIGTDRPVTTKLEEDPHQADGGGARQADDLSCTGAPDEPRWAAVKLHAALAMAPK